MRPFNEELLKESKKEYENIAIPKELNARMEEAIRKGEKKMSGKNRKFNFRIPATVLAASLCVLVLGLNTSEAFAKTMGGLPVVGSVMQFLTIKNYETTTQDENVITKVDKPEFSVKEDNGTVENATDEIAQLTAKEIAERVNAEITERVDAYTTDANARIAEYKEAFLATGGTEEQWQERNFVVDVHHEIKSQRDGILSFAMIYSENWNSGFGESKYYNISLADGSDLALSDLLGTDWRTVVEESVKEQAKKQTAEDASKSFWILDEESPFYTEEVFENPAFYVNENGNVVVVFPKYSIAPGYMGTCEFEIVTES